MTAAHAEIVGGARANEIGYEDYLALLSEARTDYVIRAFNGYGPSARIAEGNEYFLVRRVDTSESGRGLARDIGYGAIWQQSGENGAALA